MFRPISGHSEYILIVQGQLTQPMDASSQTIAAISTQLKAIHLYTYTLTTCWSVDYRMWKEVHLRN